MCTTLIVTRGATVDGSVLVGHSDDDDLCDQRIIHVPPQDHPKGARREVFGLAGRYPRLVTTERGHGYDTGELPTTPLGFIPQVRHTFGYYDGNHGIMNEHDLMIGECGDAARYQPSPVTEEEAKRRKIHPRILHSEELSRIALERCVTAREAITLMAGLIEEYGLFSTGETLLIADGQEAWVFEMCALPHPTLHSAWVARRVPDGEIFVAANEFRIREIPAQSTDDILVCPGLAAALADLGWWNPESETLDWLRAVSPGEYAHPYYSLRRVWRVLDRVNPDLCLSPWVADGYTTDYPFSVRPSHRLSLTDVFDLYRDHYEGTPFDLTRSAAAAAGPYGDPTRLVGPYDGGPGDVTEWDLPGAWERPISVHHQRYTYVNQLRPEAPAETQGLIWFGPDVAHTTCFTPFSTKAPLPQAYEIGSPEKFDRSAAWWAFDFVSNWARLNYQRMVSVDIAPHQREHERHHLALVREWDEACRRMTHDEARAYIAKQCEHNAMELLRYWWELADLLVAKYSDGLCDPPDPGQAREIGYPASWLRAAGYGTGPVSYRMPVP